MSKYVHKACMPTAKPYLDLYVNVRNTETYEIRIPINIQPTQATRRHMCLLYTVDTKTIVHALIKFFSLFGLPKSSQSDQGSKFYARDLPASNV